MSDISRASQWCALIAVLTLCPGGCGEGAGTQTAHDGNASQSAAGSADELPKSAPSVIIALVRATSDDAADRFEVRGLSAESIEGLLQPEVDAARWQQLFTVSVVTEDATEYPPMLGEYAVDAGTLIFTPQFPLAAGVRYRAVFTPDGSAGESTISETFTISPRATEPTARVTNVFPSAATLPENQLKFYVHFSAPMSRGEAYRRIHLLTADGEEVADPFLELAEELWDRDGMRFTLFIDPGRIKRGLKPREEVGPALEEGKSYVLAIDAGWLDADGLPLVEPFEKKFDVGPPDEIQPDYREWKLTAPAAGSTEPLTVAFTEPLDRGMLERVLVVTGPSGEALRGSIEIDKQETRWRFTPNSPWEPGEYSLDIGTALEDLAGNSIARPFETIIGEATSESVSAATVSRGFTVEAANGRE